MNILLHDMPPQVHVLVALGGQQHLLVISIMWRMRAGDEQLGTTHFEPLGQPSTRPWTDDEGTATCSCARELPRGEAAVDARIVPCGVVVGTKPRTVGFRHLQPSYRVHPHRWRRPPPVASVLRTAASGTRSVTVENQSAALYFVAVTVHGCIPSGGVAAQRRTSIPMNSCTSTPCAPAHRGRNTDMQVAAIMNRSPMVQYAVGVSLRAGGFRHGTKTTPVANGEDEHEREPPWSSKAPCHWFWSAWDSFRALVAFRCRLHRHP